MGGGRGCLERWSSGQKCLLAFTIILFMLFAALLGVFLYFILTHKIKADEVCMTKNCTLTAATLLTAMDTSINPCEDFNKFVCADFVRKNPVPEGKTMTTTFLQYADSYKLQIKDLIESHNPFLGDPDVVFRAQESYHVCLNRTYNLEAELMEYKRVLNETFGGWPIVMGAKWKMSNLKLEEIWGKFSRIGVFNFMFAYVGPNEENPNKNLLQVDLRTRPTPNTTDEDDYKSQLKIMKIAIELLGYSRNVDVSDIDKSFVKMEEINMFLEKELEAINSSESYKIMTIKEMNDLTEDTFDWLLYLNTLFKGIHTFKRDETVIVHSPQGIEIFDDVLRKYPARDIINILAWNKMNIELLKYLSREIEDISQDENGKASKWGSCLEWLKETYPLVVTRLFIQKFVDRKNKETADEMIQLIQKAYKDRISNSNWLDEETKKNAILKADSVQRFVGYPDFIFDDNKLEKFYKYIPKVKPTFVANYLEALSHDFTRYWESFNQPVSKEENEWEDDSVLAINAFYDPSSNTIWFPSGILQLPFFDENRIAAVNFGMIGAIIGHEIGHAFDDSGSLFDEKGNERNWWTNSTKTMYIKKAECFVQQYNQYCPEELKGGKDDKPICVDGSNTLGENLADNTGLRAAFDAYTLWTNKYGKEKRLPGLEEYTPEQIFFISYGYLWCQNLPIDKWVDRNKYAVHTSQFFRSTGALANNENFREAFKCTERNIMNRGPESCTLW